MTFEYAIVEVGEITEGSDGARAAMEHFDKLGADDWDLVSVSDGLAYFKRRPPAAQVPPINPELAVGIQLYAEDIGQTFDQALDRLLELGVPMSDALGEDFTKAKRLVAVYEAAKESVRKVHQGLREHGPDPRVPPDR